jgi:hypothetical protein
MNPPIFLPTGAKMTRLTGRPDHVSMVKTAFSPTNPEGGPMETIDVRYRFNLGDGALEVFDRIISYDTIRLDVTTRERFISQDTTAQRGISSLLGLLIATSGCPHTRFLRPMARHHLPFASCEETLYRAASMYALVILDLFAQVLPESVEGDLKKLRGIFSAYLE